jgi:hypothetical protein
MAAKKTPVMTSARMSKPPSKGGTQGLFTTAAKKAGMTPLAYAQKIMSDKTGKYSPTLRKRANFVVNASRWSKK